MPELTADQAIEQLKTLKPDEQRTVLAQVAPEKLTGIITKLGPTFLSDNSRKEGLYSLYGKVGTPENPEAVGPLSVPYSKVPAALLAGYTWFGPSQSVYEKDKAAEGKPVSQFGALKEKFEKSIEPIPSVEDEKQLKTSQFPLSNTDRAALRTLYGIPGYMRDVATEATRVLTHQSNGNELMNLLDPGNIPKGLIDQFQEDWPKDKKLAVSNLIGSIVALGIAHKTTGAAKEVVSKIPIPKPPSVGNQIRETLGVPENSQSVVEKFGKESERVRDQHQGAEEGTLKDRGKVDVKNERRQKAIERLNAKKQKQVNDSNIAQLKAEAQARLDALKENRANTTDYEEKAAAIRTENDTKIRQERERQQLESQVTDASKRLDQKYQKAAETAKKAYNATWNKWRDMVANVKVKMGTVVSTIKAQEAGMNPQQQSIFRDILRESQPDPEDMTQFERDRESAMQNLGYKKAYADLPPDRKLIIDDMMTRIGYTNLNDVADVEVPATRLHGWKSQLEQAVRNTKDGTVRFAVGKVLDSVRQLETQASASVPGAADQLSKARKITKPYFDAFFMSPEDLPKEAARSLREQSPEYVKQKAQEARLQRIAAYDPTIIGAQQHLENLQTGLEKLKKEMGGGKSGFKPLPPKPVHVPKPGTKPLKQFEPATGEKAEYPEPRSKEPLPEVPDLKEKNAKFIAEKLRKYGRWGQWIVRLIAGGLASHALFKGDVSAFSNDLLIGQMGVTLLTNALRRPSVLDWLADPSKEDLEMIGQLPPQDAVRMREALNTLSREDIRQDPKKAKTKIAPVMAAFLAGQSVVQKSYQQTATGANGHQIGSNDGGETWYDVETGQQVQ